MLAEWRLQQCRCAHSNTAMAADCYRLISWALSWGYQSQDVDIATPWSLDQRQWADTAAPAGMATEIQQLVVTAGCGQSALGTGSLNRPTATSRPMAAGAANLMFGKGPAGAAGCDASAYPRRCCTRSTEMQPAAADRDASATLQDTVTYAGGRTLAAESGAIPPAVATRRIFSSCAVLQCLILHKNASNWDAVSTFID